jgi:hypothetical protein
MAFLYGRAGRLTAENGGFWPGQILRFHDAQRVLHEQINTEIASRASLAYHAGLRRQGGQMCF